jgi:Zn-finger nucleic acid-binding protein
MEEVHGAYGKNVSRCESCHGLFIPSASMTSICREWFIWPNLKTEELIDIGDATTGRLHDALDSIDCVVCGVPMARVSVPGQSHIWLEQCEKCDGLFFDAGELSDARYKTLLDWVKDRVKGSRPDDSPARIPDLPT